MLKGKSAGRTASTVSRILRKAGLEMASRQGPGPITRGLFVHRLGYSTTVAVSYQHVRNILETREQQNAHKYKQQAAVAQAAEVLKAKGYECAIRYNQSSLHLECEYP